MSHWCSQWNTTNLFWCWKDSDLFTNVRWYQYLEVIVQFLCWFHFVLRIRFVQFVQWIHVNSHSTLGLFCGCSFTTFFIGYRKDIDYYCVVHETGRGLFTHAKGRHKGSKTTSLPCSTTMEDKIIELRKDFELNNETKMVVMRSVLMHDMNRYVAMYPKVWFIDCTAGKFFQSVWYNLYYTNLY